MSLESAVWISWQNHRRTREIAALIGVRLIVLESEAPALVRRSVLLFRTIVAITRVRPAVLIVQNPSMVLTFLAALVKPVFRYRLVVDRHTNFYLSRGRSKNPFWILVRAISAWTVRIADLTIVTNGFLADLVQSMGGRAFIAPDPIPTDFSNGVPNEAIRIGRPRIVFVSTYAKDEPTEEVVRAARQLERECQIIITGRPSGQWAEKAVQASLPSNTKLTGYIDRGAYRQLISGCNAVLVLTTLEHCLTCGAYEAVAAGKPMVLSATDAIRSHFHAGAVYVEPTSEAIAEGLRRVILMEDQLREESVALRSELVSEWRHIQAKLIDSLHALESSA